MNQTYYVAPVACCGGKHIVKRETDKAFLIETYENNFQWFPKSQASLVFINGVAGVMAPWFILKERFTRYHIRAVENDWTIEYV